MATELTREANKYRKAHSVAGESNQTLHKAMSLHVANLRTLSKPLNEIAQEIPQTVGAGAESNFHGPYDILVTNIVVFS